MKRGSEEGEEEGSNDRGLNSKYVSTIMVNKKATQGYPGSKRKSTNFSFTG